MTTLTEFLLARIAEDESAAIARVDREVALMRSDGGPSLTREDLIAMPESNAWRRPLAECKAKREIVEKTISQAMDPYEMEWPLRLLARVYADHPDYDAQEWAV